MKKRRVLVVGGGFGGTKAALELAEHTGFEVSLLSDRSNFHYHPTLYHTATGGSRAVSSLPLSDIFKDKPVNLIFGTAQKLDRHKKTIITKEGQKYEFDILILALGTITNYYGIRGLKEYSYGIKSIAEAEELKAHLHQQLIDKHQPDLNYIVVGGGPTGVELACALPAYMRQIMKAHGLRNRRVHIDLVEAAPRLMPRMPKSVSRALARRVRHLKIKLFLNTPVQAETANTLMMRGKYVRSHTVIWTAGIANDEFFTVNNFQLSSNGRVKVDNLMQAWPGIFVIGDNADTPYSGMAQTALYEARFISNNLKRHADNKRPLSYKPKKPIYITPAGPYWAAVVWGPFHIYGLLGWLLRRAADWMGYRDLHPWWKATQLLLASSDEEHSCPVCASNK